MSTFEWKQYDSPREGQCYQLHLVHQGPKPVLVGELIELRLAWFVQTYPGKDKYWLDKHLTLDEAMRAAKLFICVGRDHDAL